MSEYVCMLTKKIIPDRAGCHEPGCYAAVDFCLQAKLKSTEALTKAELQERVEVHKQGPVDEMDAAEWARWYDVERGYFLYLLHLYEAFIVFVKRPTEANATLMYEHAGACSAWAKLMVTAGGGLQTEWTVRLIGLAAGATTIADELLDLMDAVKENAMHAVAARRADKVAAELLAAEEADVGRAQKMARKQSKQKENQNQNEKKKKKKKKKKGQGERLPGRLMRLQVEAVGGVE